MTLRPATAQLLGMKTEQTTTDATGYYQFTDVVPGAYIIQVEAPARYWPITSARVAIKPALHQTLEVNFGIFRAPVVRFLPVIFTYRGN